MKYLVMECHEGFAVLMDEEARFVNAANLHYEVGQTVTEPILLETEDKPKTGRNRIIMRGVKVAATAACLAVVTFAGFSFFGKDKIAPAPNSVVFVSAAAEIEMELDDTGSVVRLKSDSERGNEIINKYIESHGTTYDKVDTANALLETQLENGYISAGDTVDVLVPADNDENYRQYKSEFQERASELDINVNIKRKVDSHPHHEMPTPPAVTDRNGPAWGTAVRPTAPEPPVTAPVAAETPDANVTAPVPEHTTEPQPNETTAESPSIGAEIPTPPFVPDEGTHPAEHNGHDRHAPSTPPHTEGRGNGIAGHGPAALPAPEAPVTPEAPAAPEAPLADEAAEAPAEPHAEELPQGAAEQ